MKTATHNHAVNTRGSRLDLFQVVAAAVFLTLVGATGCGGIARDTDTYRVDTGALLDSRGDALIACYDHELRLHPDMAGTLTLTFRVEKTTGEVIALTWDRDYTTVSEGLATCAVTAMAGLELEAPDRREGQATWRYRFVNNPPPS